MLKHLRTLLTVSLLSLSACSFQCVSGPATGVPSPPAVEPPVVPDTSLGLSSEPTFIRTSSNARAHQPIVPIVIRIDAPAAPWLKHVEAATQRWNDRTGLLLFVMSDSWAPLPPRFDEGTIVVTLDPELKDSAVTFMNWQKEDGRTSATLMTLPVHEGDEKFAEGQILLLEHEFGHALGLDHDTDVLSLMHPELTSYDQRITLTDLRAVLAVYGPMFEECERTKCLDELSTRKK